MNAPDQFRDLIADLMRDHGPDGHIDGYEIIADKAWEWCRRFFARLVGGDEE